MINKKSSLRIISEEHGKIDVVKNPKYLAVLDGIDGSSALVKDSSSKCGTIISIANNLSPNYKDFIFAGITEFITNKIIYGIKGEGVFVIENAQNNNLARKIPKFKNKSSFEDIKATIDCYDSDYAEGITKGMNEFKSFMNSNVVKYLKGKINIYGGISSASTCIDLLEGKTDAVFNMVAKGVFEPPAIYLLTKELGGFGTDLDGKDLENKKWKAVGMNLEGVLFSSSEEISKKLINLISNK